jgi:acyl-coenzyme A synthetase/AMP-(fatty) acid ligase
MTHTLLGSWHPDAPLLVHAAGEDLASFSASEVAAAVATLAAALPRRQHLLQCCTDTCELVLSTLAAWSAGQCVVMPSTRLAADVDRLAGLYPDSHVLDGQAFATLVRGCAQAPRQGGDACAMLVAAAPPRWPAPAVPADMPAVVLFTSGSTREPRAHVKTIDMLVRGAATFAGAFAPLSRPPLLVGTVDCHHMFGLEANLMAAIECGYALATQRPQFPTDLAALLQRAGSRFGPPWLVTTPLQLSTFHRGLAGGKIDVERVIVATMPLAPALARAVEGDWRARVDEIFGSTECGVMAVRRTAAETWFHPAPGVRFDFGADESATVSRPPDPPVLLDDRVAPRLVGEERAFELRGRRGDMVKIAGKRATLAVLDEHLRAIDGVADGAFIAPPGDGARLAAAAVAPRHTPQSLRAALAATIDPAFMPRPLLLVERLPRDAQGKLARAALLALVAGGRAPDAGDVSLDARAADALDANIIEERIAFDHARAFFAGHFPGNPIAPAAALLAEAAQALSRHGLRVRACEHAKFRVPVTPGDAYSLRLDLGHLPRVELALSRDGREHVRATLRCERVAAPAAPPP